MLLLVLLAVLAIVVRRMRKVERSVQRQGSVMGGILFGERARVATNGVGSVVEVTPSAAVNTFAPQGIELEGVIGRCNDESKSEYESGSRLRWWGRSQ